jgi:hypothetical protein
MVIATNKEGIVHESIISCFEGKKAGIKEIGLNAPYNGFLIEIEQSDTI